MLKEASSIENAKLNKELMNTFSLFLLISGIGVSIAIVISSKTSADKWLSLCGLWGIFAISFLAVRFVNKRTGNPTLVKWTIFINICIIYVFGYFVSLEKTMWSPVNWLPTYFIIIFSLLKKEILALFLGFHFTFIVILMIFSDHEVIFFEQAHYFASLTNILVLSFIALKYTNIFNNYQSQLNESIDLMNEKNLELTASNEEYYAAQEELFEQYDQIKDLLNSRSLLNEQFETVLNVVEDAIIDYDVSNDRFIISSVISKLFPSLSEQPFTLSALQSNFHSEDADQFFKNWRLLDNNKPCVFDLTMRSSEVVYKHEMHYYQLTMLNYTSSINQAKHKIITIKDITDQKRYEDKIVKMAYFDDLTNLANRKGYENSITEFIKNYSHKPFLFVIIDIAEFHTINNVLGYQIGDQVLMNLASRISRLKGSIVLPSRLAADRFSFAIDISSNIQQLKKQLESPIFIEGHQINIRISCGITEYPNSGKNYVELIRQAEQALGKSKQSHDAKLCKFDAIMLADSQRRLMITNELRHAVDRNEIYVLYQPIVNISSGKVHGFEALARWGSSALGNVSPFEFISIAEHTGSIDQISKKVIRETCSLIMKLGTNRSNISLSVNLSPVQLLDATFKDQLTEIIDEYRIPRSCIAIEITESTFLENFEDAKAQLNALRQAGFKIYLDDFGTGYSSLSYLSLLPIDVLKIDKSFTDEIIHDHVKFELLKSIVQIGKTMGIKTVIEGVEHIGQLEMLRQTDADYVQGYFYSKPISDDEALKYFLNHHV